MNEHRNQQALIDENETLKFNIQEMQDRFTKKEAELSTRARCVQELQD